MEGIFREQLVVGLQKSIGYVKSSVKDKLIDWLKLVLKLFHVFVFSGFYSCGLRKPG